jgi:hypothetical protein
MFGEPTGGIAIVKISIVAGAPSPVFVTGTEPRFHRIFPYIVHNSFQLIVVAYPMVVGLLLPESTGTTQNGIGFISCVAFQRVHDLCEGTQLVVPFADG